MTLEWILRENGIDPEKDVTIDTSISFAAMSGSFISGIGDYVSLFDLNVYLGIFFQNKKTFNSSFIYYHFVRFLVLNFHNLLFQFPELF